MTTANDDIRERVSRIEGRMEALATKEDMQAVRTEVATIQALIPTLATKEDVQAIRTDNEALRGEAKADNEALRADMHRMETRLIKWMTGAVVGGLGAAGALAGAVSYIIVRLAG